mgnify:CR=1 FL=1
MQNRKENGILRELFRLSRLSMETAELVLPSVRDRELKEQIERQLEGYRTAAEKSAELLRRHGVEPAEAGGLVRRAVRNSVRLGVARNRSSRRIAQLGVKGTTAAMADLTRAMDRFADGDPQSRKIAEEYLDAGQKSVDRLRKYL